MNRHEEATAFIVSELSKHRNRNEIILALCERIELLHNRCHSDILHTDRPGKAAMIIWQRLR